MSWLAESAERVYEEWERLDLRVPYASPMCLYAVSKDIRGELIHRDHDLQTCPSGCDTMKHFLELRAQVVAGPCDSAEAASLDGYIEGELVAAFEGDGDKRGSHGVKAKWGGAGSDAAVLMAGINNAGTHRPPLLRCENCDEHGHMEGRFRGVIVDGEHTKCAVSGIYMIRYDASTTGTDTSFEGTMEGSILCDC